MGSYTLQAGTAAQNTRANLITDINGSKVTTTTGNIKTASAAATTAAGALTLSVSGAEKGTYSVTAGTLATQVVFTNTATGQTSGDVTVAAGAGAQTVDLSAIGLGNLGYTATGVVATDRANFIALGTFEITGNSQEGVGAIKIQIGALEGEQLELGINKMDSEGLGINSQSIATQAGAGEAVTATRNAINTVSDQRALLGAMQNRLEHKINNLNVSSENLSSAESRIRDVDIAKEMTNYTKNNILSQAATAMLAQANSAPQNVLSLLK